MYTIQPPLMDAENLLTIFDCYWFEQEILKKQPNPSNSEAYPVQKTQELPNQSLPTISTKSMDELTSISSGSSNNSLSPSSVLVPSKLKTIFSGKEVKDTSRGGGDIGEASRTVEVEIERRRNSGREHRKKKLARGFSKSLSDLEFEELKGFMELGFVFSEEDKGSDFLTTILPGLQRLGAEEEGQKEEGNLRRKSEDGFGNSRPYLSEVWEVSERNRMRRRRENHPLMKSWEKLPSVGNKIDMKDYIKTWAHSVASSVR